MITLDTLAILKLPHVAAVLAMDTYGMRSLLHDLA
jgi:hypothetical protein